MLTELTTIELNHTTSLCTLRLKDAVSVAWILPSLVNLKESKLVSVVVDYEPDWKDFPLIKLDHALQGRQFSNLRQVRINVNGTYADKVRRMFAESRAKGILLLE